MVIPRTLISAIISGIFVTAVVATGTLYASGLNGKRLFYSEKQRKEQQQGAQKNPTETTKGSRTITNPEPVPVQKKTGSITYSGFIRMKSQTVYFINGKPANESVYSVKYATRQGDQIKVRLPDHRVVELYIGRPLFMDSP